ncbi:AraC family transcriptional regulator [bacterium]|jgi:AraC-like DNA-binding protein|nr:AraC family transcriptional regulator [bacterium]
MRKPQLDSAEFEIFTQIYHATIRYVSPGLFHMVRNERYPGPTKLVNTHGINWLIGFSDLSPNQLSVRDGKKLVSRTGPAGMYIPPFQLIEYHLESGSVDWEAFVSTAPPPADIPTEPVIFHWDGTLPKTVDEAFDIIRKRTDSHTLRVEKKASRIAPKAKKFLETNFRDDVKISDIAKNLGCSRVVLSRDFQQTYGISLVAYRHRLRIFEAMHLMNEGKSITHAIFESGFSDPAQFIHHFKKEMHTTPKSFDPYKEKRSSYYY